MATGVLPPLKFHCVKSSRYDHKKTMKTHGTRITPWAVVSVVFVAEVTVRNSKEYAAANDVKELVS